ncbi:MAG: MFS transporter [Peptostreptococcaceae bacterium]
MAVLDLKGNKGVSNQKISTKEYIAYFFYGFGQVLNYAMVGTYLTIFYTDYLMISASIAGAIFLVARIWDAINDPMMAAIIDCTNSPKGKFRVWMKWISIFIVLTTVLTFIPWNMKGPTLVAVAGISYILWGMVYTVSDVPFWSLSTVMSNDSQERAKAVTVANTGVSLGFLMPGLLVPITARFIGSEILGYELANNIAFMKGLPWTIMLYSILTYPMMVFGYLGTKERRNANVEKVKFKDMFVTAKSAKPLFVVCTIFMINVFNDLQGALMTYFFIWNLGNIDYQSVVSFFSMFAFCTMIFYPMLTKRFKKKNILQAQLIIDTLLRVMLFVVGYEKIGIVLVLIIVMNYLNTLTSSLIPNMIGECVEYCEYKTGKRTEGIVFSFQTFSGKMKTAIALGISGFVLTWIGYNPLATNQESTVLNGIFMLCIIGPAIGNVLKLIATMFIKYTEEEYNLIVKYLGYKYSKIEAEKENNEAIANKYEEKMRKIDLEIRDRGLN